MANSLQIYEETIDLCGGGSSCGTSYTPSESYGIFLFQLFPLETDLYTM